MIHIAFLNQYFLVQKEVISSLKRIPGARIIVIDVADFPTPEQAHQVCRVLDDNDCRILITINDWGLDAQGQLAQHCRQKSILHGNWCVDDPFFMELFHGRTLSVSPNRIDFVSNKAYVQALGNRGISAHFLPLAADPSLFFPLKGNNAAIRSAGFVGNSYRKQVDDLCGKFGPFMETLVPFMGEILKLYESDLSTNIEAKVEEKVSALRLPESLPPTKAVFIIKHFISYLFRKKFICSLSNIFSDFMVFGDEFWLCDLPPERVSMSVGYYTNLNQTYASITVNIDINRIVITEGFTQRIFDCLAGGNFVLTSKKDIVEEFFQICGDQQEVAVFDNQAHCGELINYFVKHEHERKAIANRGMRRVLAHHTYDHRIVAMFTILSDYISAKARG